MEKSKIIVKLFQHIVTYSYLLLPLLFLLLRIKKKDGFVLAIYGLVFFFLLYFFYDIPKEWRKVYNTLYTFLEYSFFTTLFYFNIQSKKFRKIIILFSVGFVVFQGAHLAFSQSVKMDSVPIGVESILIFIFITLFFVEKLNIQTENFIYTNHFFWISVGLLLYLGGSFFINILANSFTEIEAYWYLNYIADTIKTILFAVALVVLYKKAGRPSKQISSIPNLDMI